MIILTDVDGVLLNWGAGFSRFVYEVTGVRCEEDISKYKLSKRFMDFDKRTITYLYKAFNRSFAGSNLAPWNDSIKYIHKMREKGVQFHVITSFNPDVSDMTYYRHRIENLEKVFGVGVFDRIIDIEEKQDYINKHYAGVADFFIEDKGENIIGIDDSINTVLMQHPYNHDYDKYAKTTCLNWASFYNKYFCD